MESVNSLCLLLLFLLYLEDAQGLFFRKKPINQLINDPYQVKPTVIDSTNLFGWMNLKNHVKFKLWTRRNPKLAHEIKVGDLESLHTSNFNTSRLTKLVVHGYAHSANEIFLEDWIIALRDAYLRLADVNFIIIDYTLLALPALYWFSGADLATKCLVDFISFLVDNGAKLQEFHLLGYSWGAHVAGNAGMKFGGGIGRITGLDPANPTYRLVENDMRLDKSDAQFVDIIHTNGGGLFMDGYLGLSKTLGHVDIFPNGGQSQPGCPIQWTYIFETIECDHSRSVLYFVESITSPMAFPACRCQSWDKFVRGQCPCDPKDMTFLGEHIDHSRRGVYFLFTRSQEPYGMGPRMDISLPDLGETGNEDLGSILRLFSHLLLNPGLVRGSRYTRMHEIAFKREIMRNKMNSTGVTNSILNFKPFGSQITSNHSSTINSTDKNLRNDSSISIS